MCNKTNILYNLFLNINSTLCFVLELHSSQYINPAENYFDNMYKKNIYTHFYIA